MANRQAAARSLASSLPNKVNDTICSPQIKRRLKINSVACVYNTDSSPFGILKILIRQTRDLASGITNQCLHPCLAALFNNSFLFFPPPLLQAPAQTPAGLLIALCVPESNRWRCGNEPAAMTDSCRQTRHSGLRC